MDDPATRLKGRQPRLGDGPGVSRPRVNEPAEKVRVATEAKRRRKEY